MSSDRWKRHEREIARLLGGRRLPNNGSGQPDVVAVTAAGTLAVQVKTRTSVPAWLTAAMGQATRDAIATDPEAIPIVVIAHPSPGVGTRRYAVLELEQLVRLFVPEAVVAVDPCAEQESRAGKIGHRQTAYPDDFGLPHVRARETGDRRRTGSPSRRTGAAGADRPEAENPYENTRKVFRNSAGTSDRPPERTPGGSDPA